MPGLDRRYGRRRWPPVPHSAAGRRERRRQHVQLAICVGIALGIAFALWWSHHGAGV